MESNSSNLNNYLIELKCLIDKNTNITQITKYFLNDKKESFSHESLRKFIILTFSKTWDKQTKSWRDANDKEIKGVQPKKRGRHPVDKRCTGQEMMPPDVISNPTNTLTVTNIVKPVIPSNDLNSTDLNSQEGIVDTDSESVDQPSPTSEDMLYSEEINTESNQVIQKNDQTEDKKDSVNASDIQEKQETNIHDSTEPNDESITNNNSTSRLTFEEKIMMHLQQIADKMDSIQDELKSLAKPYKETKKNWNEKEGLIEDFIKIYASDKSKRSVNINAELQNSIEKRIKDVYNIEKNESLIINIALLNALFKL